MRKAVVRTACRDRGLRPVKQIILPGAVAEGLLQDIARLSERLGALNDPAVPARRPAEAIDPESMSIGLLYKCAVTCVHRRLVKVSDFVIAKAVNVIFVEPHAIG